MSFENPTTYSSKDLAPRVGAPVRSEKQVALDDAAARIGELALTKSAEMRESQLNVEVIEHGYYKDVRGSYGIMMPTFFRTANCPAWFILGRLPNESDEKDYSNRPLWHATESSFNGKFSTDYPATLAEFFSSDPHSIRNRVSCFAKAVALTPSGNLLTVTNYLHKDSENESGLEPFKTRGISGFCLADVMDTDHASVGHIRSLPDWFEAKMESAKKFYAGRAEKTTLFSYYPYPWDLNGTPLPSLEPALHAWLPKNR
jgi:hypothetical protein